MGDDNYPAIVVASSRGAELLHDLRYINYAQNRTAGMPAARLATIYPQAESFERRYLDEIAARGPEAA